MDYSECHAEQIYIITFNNSIQFSYFDWENINYDIDKKLNNSRVAIYHLHLEVALLQLPLPNCHSLIFYRI